MFDHEPSTNTEAAILAGIETARPHKIHGDVDESTLYVVRDSDGTTRVIDTRDHDDHYLAHPRRKTGRYDVTRVESFLDYLDRHGNEQTEITVNTAEQNVAAHLDGHGPDLAGHEDHKIVLAFPKSDQWKTWMASNGKAMRQLDFAEFIEDNLLDIVDPAAADMLEIATSLSATTKATFHSAHRLSDGQTEFEWTEETSAKAGNKAGRLDIPARFQIGIPIFRGSEDTALEARFRYRINNGDLVMSYHLDRPRDVVETAFDLELNVLRTGVGDKHPIYIN